MVYLVAPLRQVAISIGLPSLWFVLNTEIFHAIFLWNETREEILVLPEVKFVKENTCFVNNPIQTKFSEHQLN